MVAKRMSQAAIKKMNQKRYGKSGKKPTQKELQASFARQAPSVSSVQTPRESVLVDYNFDDEIPF